MVGCTIFGSVNVRFLIIQKLRIFKLLTFFSLKILCDIVKPYTIFIKPSFDICAT